MFYCCFVEGTGGFAKKHDTFESARIEAERLCKKEGKRVYILTPMITCVPGAPEWKSIEAIEAVEPLITSTDIPSHRMIYETKTS